MTQSSDKGFGWWSWGLTRGRLQGSPAPRQMCLGVTSHPQQNESPNRCLTSRPGCHASHTHTCTHQPCKAMHTHGTIYYYIGKSGSTRGQTKALTFTLLWLWPKITKQRFNWTYSKVFVGWGEKNPVMCTKYTQHTDWSVVLLKLAESHEMFLQNNVVSDTLFDVWLLPSENNIERQDKKTPRYFCTSIPDFF